MRNAATILNVLQTRGTKNKPLENGTYRLLYNPNLYLRAYAKLYPNQGTLTPGIDADDTADGMKIANIERLIDALRAEKYRWRPVRRTYIPKRDGKRRALGIPTWTDKLLQEVIRSLLEAYYEPQFSNLSHGFRPIRGCDTALRAVQRYWTGTKWFIEGDIRGCFDAIDHEILMEILSRNIHDQRFLTLLRRFLNAGYMEDWKVENNLSGTPQGGVLSPLLSNIYLNELDWYVEKVLIPANTKGTTRKNNPEYRKYQRRRHERRQQGDYTQDKELTAIMRRLPSNDPNDPNFRRLRYIRYADDFLLGFIGHKREAVQIKDQLSTFLEEVLNLELSKEKTLITHARSQPARFLGYEIQTQYANDQLGSRGQRSVNGVIGLRVPQEVIRTLCKEYMQYGKPTHNAMLSLESDFSIVATYGSKLRGIVQYYRLAWNVHHLWQLASVMRRSLLKTLALQQRSTTQKMWQKYKSVVDNGTGRAARCLAVVIDRKNEGKKPLVARFGGIPLRRDATATTRDLTLKKYTEVRSELLQRLLADTCEVCETKGNIEVHHIRAMRDLYGKGKRPKKPWQIKQAALERKTLMVCRPCHLTAHGGNWKPRQ